MKNLKIILVTIICSLQFIFAQEKEETNFDEFVKNFKRDYFSVGMLIQSVADFQPERTFSGNNGFSVSNMRLKIYGTLDKNFEYSFQGNFAISPFLLDANISYKFSDFAKLTAGQFKTPFSKEYLTYAGDIDFVNRSMVVSLLAPKRDMGLQLSGSFFDKILNYRVGIFNGNGINKLFNDNNEFLYVGRISAKTTSGKSSFEAGINAGYSKDFSPQFIGRNFNGKRTMYGADVRAEINNFLLAGEIIGNKFDGSVDSLQLEKNPFGYHITAGYRFSGIHQLLIRLDSISPDGIANDKDLIILGYNFWPTKATEIQFNYVIDSDNSEFKNHQYLFNFQVSL